MEHPKQVASDITTIRNPASNTNNTNCSPIITITISRALTSARVAHVRELLLAYAAALPVDLAYQGFAAELDALPGVYAAESRGTMLVAYARRQSSSRDCVGDVGRLKNDYGSGGDFGAVSTVIMALAEGEYKMVEKYLVETEAESDVEAEGQPIACVGLKQLIIPTTLREQAAMPDGASAGGWQDDHSYNGQRCHKMPADGDGGQDICEVKRLFVTPAFRRHGMGRRLMDAVLDEARRLGYREVRLDTLRSMEAALALYKDQLGFVEVGRYYEGALKNTVFLGRRL